jgi:8-oxo-dGTP pyrophosphatase MutT (NUDIX family)
MAAVGEIAAPTRHEPDPEPADFPDYDDAFLAMVNDMDVVPEDVRGADVVEVPARYVAGFMFSPDETRVALVMKKRPAWQAGMWNGIGGHIEPGETVHDAMVREFAEETGVLYALWERFATLSGDGFAVDWFRCTSSLLDGVRSATDEAVGVHPVPLPPDLPTIPNLGWLVPMALKANRHEWPFDVVERAALRSPEPAAGPSAEPATGRDQKMGVTEQELASAGGEPRYTLDEAMDAFTGAWSDWSRPWHARTLAELFSYRLRSGGATTETGETDG